MRDQKARLGLKRWLHSHGHTLSPKGPKCRLSLILRTHNRGSQLPVPKNPTPLASASLTRVRAYIHTPPPALPSRVCIHPHRENGSYNRPELSSETLLIPGSNPAGAEVGEQTDSPP